MKELKAWPRPFQAMWDRVKPFEFRKNDRDFRSGDVLHIMEWEPATEEYTGRWLSAQVSHIEFGPAWGIPDGYVVLGLFWGMRVGIGSLLGSPEPENTALTSTGESE